MVAEAIDVVLDDLGEPWYAKHVPLHKKQVESLFEFNGLKVN